MGGVHEHRELVLEAQLELRDVELLFLRGLVVETDLADAELVLDDVWVPDENLLGTPHRGFYEIMKNFQNERLVICAMAVGSAQAAIDSTLAYTQERTAFDGHLFDLGAIGAVLLVLLARLPVLRRLLCCPATRRDGFTRAVEIELNQ